MVPDGPLVGSKLVQCVDDALGVFEFQTDPLWGRSLRRYYDQEIKELVPDGPLVGSKLPAGVAAGSPLLVPDGPLVGSKLLVPFVMYRA